MRLFRLRLIACLALLVSFAGMAGAQSSEDTLYTVLNPTGIAPVIERSPLAPRPAGLDGKTIYLVDVTFNGGDLFLQEMQKWMGVHMPDVQTEFRIKRGIYSADDPELWREIQSAGGMMVMAIGH